MSSVCLPVHAVEVIEQPLVLGRVLLVVGRPEQECELGSIHAALRDSKFRRRGFDSIDLNPNACIAANSI